METQAFGAEYLETVEVAAHGGMMAKDKTCYVQDFTGSVICVITPRP